GSVSPPLNPLPQAGGEAIAPSPARGGRLGWGLALLGIVDPATTCVARLAAGLSGSNASHDIY
ncbi:hypothetical protein, partial [Sulfuricella sp.]|uniref:hypothetical protein n=1 Tax=Sulfuricella sp. TaxID=2099377 RepID=UPI002C0F6A29